MTEAERRRAQEPLGRRLEAGIDEDDLARAWRAIEARRRPASRPRRRAQLGLGVAVALAAAGALYLRPDAPEPRSAPIARTAGALHDERGAVLARIAPGHRVALEEGSSIETDAAGELDVLTNTAGELALHLVSGGAHFSVTPGGPRRWRIEGGGVSVEVVGTVFDVVRDGERMRVRVERGSVIVRGEDVPDTVRRLVAGEQLVIGPEHGHEHASEVPRAPVDPLASGARPPPVAHVDRTAREAPRPASTSDLPAQAEVDERDEPTRWLEEADHARREDRLEDAVAVLERLVEQHPSSHEAPIAEYTRARLLMRLERAAEARRAYARAIELGLPPALDAAARDALDAR